MNARRWWSWTICLLVVGCGRDSSVPPIQTTGASDSADMLAGIVTAPAADTLTTLEQKRIELETQLDLAQQAAARGELDQAIELLEGAVLLDSKHRTVLLLLAQHMQARSKALIEEDPGRAYGLMVQSGGYLRALCAAHSDFSAEEKELIANILFDEACAHARSKRREEWSASLNAAITAGYSDRGRLQSEPDFAEFRQVPELAAVLDQAAQSIAGKSEAD